MCGKRTNFINSFYHNSCIISKSSVVFLPQLSYNDYSSNATFNLLIIEALAISKLLMQIARTPNEMSS